MYLITSVIYSEKISSRVIKETWEEAIKEYDDVQDSINPKEKGWTRLRGCPHEIVNTRQFAFDGYNQGHIAILKI